MTRLEGAQHVGRLDFTKTAAAEWWKEHLRELLRMGASVLKADDGEGTAPDGVLPNGQKGDPMHNLYTALYAQTTFEAAREVTGQGLAPRWKLLLLIKIARTQP